MMIDEGYNEEYDPGSNVYIVYTKGDYIIVNNGMRYLEGRTYQIYKLTEFVHDYSDLIDAVAFVIELDANDKDTKNMSWEIKFEEFDGVWVHCVYKNDEFMCDFLHEEAARVYVDMCKFKYHVLYNPTTYDWDIFEKLKWHSTEAFFNDAVEKLEGLSYIIYEDESPFTKYIADDGTIRIRPRSSWLQNSEKTEVQGACKGDDGLIRHTVVGNEMEGIPAGPGYDMVNHPPHYNTHPSGIECIDVVKWFNFNIGNVIKYVWRAGLKDKTKTIEDLEKAKFYLQNEIDRLKGIQ